MTTKKPTIAEIIFKNLATESDIYAASLIQLNPTALRVVSHINFEKLGICSEYKLIGSSMERIGPYEIVAQVLCDHCKVMFEEERDEEMIALGSRHPDCECGCPDSGEDMFVSISRSFATEDEAAKACRALNEFFGNDAESAREQRLIREKTATYRFQNGLDPDTGEPKALE